MFEIFIFLSNFNKIKNAEIVFSNEDYCEFKSLKCFYRMNNILIKNEIKRG